MGFFECCHVCKAPKRYPGCHDKCPDYIKQKAKWEDFKHICEQKRLEDPMYLKTTKYKF